MADAAADEGFWRAILGGTGSRHATPLRQLAEPGTRPGVAWLSGSGHSCQSGGPCACSGACRSAAPAVTRSRCPDENTDAEVPRSVGRFPSLGHPLLEGQLGRHDRALPWRSATGEAVTFAGDPTTAKADDETASGETKWPKATKPTKDKVLAKWKSIQEGWGEVDLTPEEESAFGIFSGTPEGEAALTQISAGLADKKKKYKQYPTFVAEPMWPKEPLLPKKVEPFKQGPYYDALMGLFKELEKKTVEKMVNDFFDWAGMCMPKCVGLMDTWSTSKTPPCGQDDGCGGKCPCPAGKGPCCSGKCCNPALGLSCCGGKECCIKQLCCGGKCRTWGDVGSCCGDKWCYFGCKVTVLQDGTKQHECAEPPDDDTSKGSQSTNCIIKSAAIPQQLCDDKAKTCNSKTEFFSWYWTDADGAYHYGYPPKTACTSGCGCIKISKSK